MSDSDTCSEDDFESADEGASGDDYVIIPDVKHDHVPIESTGAKQDELVNFDLSLDFPVDNKPHKVLVIDQDPVHSSPSESREEIKIESEEFEIEIEELIDDYQGPAASQGEKCLGETKSENEESEKTVLLQSTPSPSPPNDVPKSGDLDIPHSNLDENADAQVLPEILEKISTRTISSRGKRERSKPTLGAKKLGAVRISNSNQSTIAASVFSEDQNEPIKPKIVPELLKEESRVPAKVADEPSEEISSGGGWGWFGPPKSLMTSVSAFTTQILSSVETGLSNIPEPEELARENFNNMIAENEDGQGDFQEEESLGFSQLVGGVSNITRMVGSTSSMVFSSGLDTLELLGKKTFTALQQTDPGLRKTKAVLTNPIQGSNDLPSLSQVLRDAKEQNETCSQDQGVIKSEKTAKKYPLTLNTLFEQFHGFAHLEALEMLSQQCNLRISPQMYRLTSQRKAVLEEIHQICEQRYDADESFDNDELFYGEVLEKNINRALNEIGIKLPIEKLIDAFNRGHEKSYDNLESSKDIYDDALRSLAEVSSLSVELMHKCAELLLMPKSAVMKADGKMETEVLQNLAFTIMREISNVGSHYANEIIRTEAAMQTNSNYSTDIYYEASNCNAYLQKAFKLLSPILKARTFQ